MKRWLAALALVGTWAVLSTSSAFAQLGTYNPPQVTPGQTFSPYLNMIRNNPAVNYFGIVQPQMQTYGQLQQLQQNIQYGQTGTTTQMGLTSQAMGNNALITGHPVTFGYTAQFFPTTGSQLAGMGVGTGLGGVGAGGGLGGNNFGAGFGTGIGGAGPTINTPLPQGFLVPAR